MLADATLADKGLADDVDAVIGVDTHTDSHSACVVDARGTQLASLTVETTAQGYGRLLAFVAEHVPGPRLVWAVEGTRSHGVGLTRFLHQAGQHVIEAGRPKRAQRRPGGKSDARDALLAARCSRHPGAHRPRGSPRRRQPRSTPTAAAHPLDRVRRTHRRG